MEQTLNNVPAMYQHPGTWLKSNKEIQAMKSIPLTQGKIALVDDGDFEWLNQWKWCCSGDGYAKRLDVGRKTILMHRIIAETPAGMDTDHINGDTLDNRRENLRVCSHHQNTQNRGINRNNVSGKKGVYWRKDMEKWRVVIKVNYQPIHVGYFDDLEEASRAYDEAAKKYRGEFARLNE